MHKVFKGWCHVDKWNYIESEMYCSWLCSRFIWSFYVNVRHGMQYCDAETNRKAKKKPHFSWEKLLFLQGHKSQRSVIYSQWFVLVRARPTCLQEQAIIIFIFFLTSFLDGGGVGLNIFYFKITAALCTQLFLTSVTYSDTKLHTNLK